MLHGVEYVLPAWSTVSSVVIIDMTRYLSLFGAPVINFTSYHLFAFVAGPSIRLWLKLQFPTLMNLCPVLTDCPRRRANAKNIRECHIQKRSFIREATVRRLP